ncbi:MAG: hypothetical protein ACI97A_000393 [Planctomycetota bacterium]|jgi:hypothetical protein
MKRITLASLCLLAFAMMLPAQVVHVLESGTPGIANDVNLPSQLDPVGGGTLFGAEPLPGSGALFPGPLSGGMTIDQVTSTIYASDGFTITTDINPRYFPFVAVVPFPGPPAPAPAIVTGGPITGMAIDTVAGILWMTDGFGLAGFAPVAPYPMIVPPVPLPFVAPFTGGLSGLDWEPSSGTFWACDPTGGIYHFFLGGAPIGPQPVTFVPAAGPLGGLAVNRANGAGSIGIPFCSTQAPGFHINVTDGFMIYDALAPGSFIPNPASSGTPARGLGYSADFQVAFGAVGCPTTGAFPFAGMMKATHTGPGGANAIKLVGGSPSTLSLLLYDICPVPGGLFIPASGETLYINPLSPTFAFAPFVSDAAGSVTVPVSYSFAATGITFTLQWAIFDALAPLGYCLSDAFQFISGLP